VFKSVLEIFMGDIATTFKELENINSLMVLKGSIGQMTCDLDKDVQDF
jgi:hypothetical protein